MLIRNKTAIVLLAIMVAVVFSGCCMKRDIQVVDAKINNMRADQQQMKESLNRLDSLFYSDAEESVKLRAEIRSSLGDIRDQFQMMQANMNDLQDKVNYMTERSSGGVPIRTQPVAPVKAGDTTAAAQTAPGINCQELYDESFINIRRGQYEGAIQGFTEYLKYCGTQDMADNARFWIGEAYYSMENYQAAIGEFRKLLKDYPNSEKQASAYYKMARSYEELGQKSDARATFQKLVDNFSGTLEAEQAKEKLKEL
ncbi:MAG: tol-pal system protein YbgF [candidate division Zixibacteria bacterium HGW-Zixibacteria-1]|nr:MAG: tol-pal system protein YbgF [candidate division Zixibacteria bacterium HGW-Zixibacteria-1]